ncbi:MAG: outer membrane protein transport protein [Ignavibacteriaceae bacterium]|nr:outer membrane protein transport protein [Ignavibacteriaceae bacterium]
MYRFVLVLSVLILSLQSSFATDGYFRHGYGIKNSAMGGAGTALSLASTGAITNPASIAFLNSGFSVDLAIFSPERSYNVFGNPSNYPGTFPLKPGKYLSSTEAFIFPTLGANWKLGEKFAVGVVGYGNGGMNSDYQLNVFHDPFSKTTGVNIEQMFVGAAVAFQFAKGHAIGVEPLFGYQRFSAKGLLAFSMFSKDPNSITGNSLATSMGFGGRIGYQGKLLPFLSIGGSYQSKIFMSPFERYQGLFAQEGDFDVPATWNAGIAINASQKLTLALDVQQILYSGVKSVSNKMDLVNNSPMTPTGGQNANFSPLGSENGWGFGWEDVTVVKIGAMFKPAEDWTLMAGFSQGKQAFDEKEVMFNILAPAVVKQHLTFGLSKKFEDREMTIGFMYAPKSSVEGTNPLEAPNQQSIRLEMMQWQLELGYSFSSL